MSRILFYIFLELTLKYKVKNIIQLLPNRITKTDKNHLLNRCLLQWHFLFL